MNHALSSCRLLALLVCLWGLATARPLGAENSHDETLKAATEALAKDRLEEAIQLDDQVLNAPNSTRSQRASAFAGRCATRYKQSLNQRNPGLLPQAIGDCDRAVELKSDLQQAYRIRGVALLSAGHADRAAEDLSVALALNPEDVLAFQNRALALAKLGRGREAMAELDAAIRLKPDQPWSYYNRGRLRVAQGDYETSIDDFIAFIRFKRDHEEVYRLRGMSRLLIGLPQQAVGDFHESLRLRPKSNPEALLARGMAYFLLDRHAEAEQDLAQAMTLNPTRVETRLWLYLTRLKLGKPGRELLTDPVIKRSQQSWPEALVFVFLGDIPAERGLEAARAGEDAVESRLRENLTLLLYGHKARIDGKEADATRWLETIQAGQEREAPYYRLARQAMRHAPLLAANPAGQPPVNAVAALAAPGASEPKPSAKGDERPASAARATPRSTSGPESQAPRSPSRAPIEPEGESAAAHPEIPATPTFADKPIPAPREPLRPRAPTPTVKEIPRAAAKPPEGSVAPSGKPVAALPATKATVAIPQAPIARPVPSFEETRVRVPEASGERVAMPGAAPDGRAPKKTPAPTRIVNDPEAASDENGAAAPRADKPVATGAPGRATSPAEAARAADPRTDLPTAKKPTGKSKGGYIFTAASYSTATYANNGLDQFLRLGVPAYVEAGQVREKTFHRIVIGPFPEQGEAEEARARVGEMLKQKPGEISKR
ncbi:MAG: tetratricopeptide repeat protein [Magnetococcales bacterium]|nr:tetratricopeptide repeat protein [Magnetococcales bacterium]